MMLEDGGYGEEQIPLSLILEAVFFSEAVFFGNPGQAERLTGEAAAQDVEGGDVGYRDFVDVAGGFFTEIGGVGLAGEFVPVAGEDAFGAGAFEGEAEAAYAAEKVDEPKLSRAGRRALWAFASGRIRSAAAVGEDKFNDSFT